MIRVFFDVFLKQDGLSRNLPIYSVLNIWSLPDLPELVISGVFMSIEIKQELRAHMALVTRQEELRAKSSYGMSSRFKTKIGGLMPVRI